MLFKKLIPYLFSVLLAGMQLNAHATLTIEITQGVDSALPIAVVPFDTSRVSHKFPVDLAEIVASDLNRSGVLKAMDRGTLPASPHYSNQVQYSRWRNAGQDYLVVGRVLERAARQWEAGTRRASGPPVLLEPRCGEGDRRVKRGGSWKGRPVILRSSARSRVREDYPKDSFGFRVARDLAP